MQRVGLQRLARRLGRDPVERARAEEIDHDRDHDDGERPERRLDRVAIDRDRRAAPPPRSPRRRAGTAARSRRAPRRSRPCRGRSDAPRRPACRRCAPRNRSSRWRRDRSANAPPPTGSRASPVNRPTTPLASVSAAGRRDRGERDLSLMSCIGGLVRSTGSRGGRWQSMIPRFSFPCRLPYSGPRKCHERNVVRVNVVTRWPPAPRATLAPLLRRADDGMDRPALPVFPSPAHAPRAALYRDADHRRRPARRPRAAARLRSGRASGGAAAWRLGPARAGRMRAHRRRISATTRSTSMSAARPTGCRRAASAPA